ncbi:fungal-specific transcription factor domain-containing protein [Desarmillaria tabescens]|uniref:Fungal-specific transcription factor domain-containing protein n=1 Tax=Armillaria tabescens TaxID=1929756 RepID=A0AA39K1U9_ARMTA|nr:fungal-specific transcription factor domain-containing protein [Desarmillaria tabescens]KAK0452965.1 fungal-specific transcription factor domain-containing protein [Desarmillaria tabescens]
MSTPTPTLTPSFYGASVELSRPSHDVYNQWYQQRVNFYDYRQMQQRPIQQVNDRRPIEPGMQRDRHNSYGQMMSNMYQNCLPSIKAAPPSVEQPQKTPPDKTTPTPTRDMDGSSNRNGDNALRRRPGACIGCKKVKMKCNFAPGEKKCQRCKPKGYRCIVEAPKPKVYKRERLLAEIRQKDAVIERLLKQLYNPYITTPHSIDEYLKSVSPSDLNNPNVLAWLSRLKSAVQTDVGSSFNRLREGIDEAGGEYDSGQWLHDQRYNLPVYSNQEARDCEEMQTPLTESLHAPVGPVPDLTFTSRSGEEGERENSPRGTACEPQESSSKPGSFHRYRNLDHWKGTNSSEILALGLVTLEDAEQLFDIFYKYINPFISILDPILLTPKSTLARCPVLFTVICAISSRYHPLKSNIYPIAMHFAKHSAANVLIQDEMKSIELCQAYILMSVYAVPKRSWDRDQSWLYAGLAVSIATALHLYQTPTAKPENEIQEREALNRDRIWQSCSLLDRGTAIQFGKPWTIKEDMTIIHSEEWYKQSHYNLDSDVHLCGYSALLRIISRFHDEVLSKQSRLIHSERGNLRVVTMRYDAELEIFQEEWRRKFRAGGFRRGAMLKCSQLYLYVAYFKLVMFSFGFHQVFHRGIETWYDYFFSKSLEYAKSVIRCVNEDLAPSGFMRYAPDHHFMCIGFAAVFLFKLLRPEFSSLLDNADRDESMVLIGTLIEKFSSSDIAVDDRHTPKLYARFLATMLGKYQRNDQRTAFGVSQTVSRENIGIPRNIGGEANGHGYNQQSSVAPEQSGYDSLGFDYSSEATHSTGTPLVQSGSEAYFLHFTYGSGNTNENGGVGGQGSMEDGMSALIQELNNTEWLREMLMPGYGLPVAIYSRQYLTLSWV